MVLRTSVTPSTDPTSFCLLGFRKPLEQNLINFLHSQRTTSCQS